MDSWGGETLPVGEGWARGAESAVCVCVLSEPNGGAQV